jgi:hypothetical protein
MALNLSQYTLTFDDEFTTLSISPAGPGTKWIAHTPWNGDFGDAQFANPGPSSGPFSQIPGGGLQITAQQVNGAWQSGLIASRDAEGPNAYGFAQQYGYFEISAKLPEGP